MECYYLWYFHLAVFVMYFIQMSEQVNNDLSLSGKIPSGLFNSMFNFKGNWKQDAKLLAFDGCFIALSDRVKLEIPSSWNPAAIAK